MFLFSSLKEDGMGKQAWKHLVREGISAAGKDAIHNRQDTLSVGVAT